MANEMILVVDADKKSQKVLEVCFKKAGYRVVLADSIVQAMRCVEQNPPSLIISDTVFLDGDGLEFCADLKHNPAYKDIPFIFLTEDRSLPQKMRGFELGADDYLTKPIYIKEVTTRVDLLLQKRSKESLLEAVTEDFEGDLSDITMIDLLQNIESERLSGSVVVKRGTRQAIIYFREGNLLDAVCGKMQGEDAVYRVMMWPEGRFLVRYHEHSRRVDHIEKSTDALLLEGIHRLDEWNELVAQLPAMEHVFALDYQKVSGQIDDFPGEVERVVRLFDGYRTLYDVVDDSPLEDIVTLHIISKLLEEKMLNNVTPMKATALNTTVLDASGLNAWLSTDLRDTNPGLPFSHLEHELDESEKIERLERSGAVADEIATVDLHREHAADETSAGGGHWKFHWSEGDLGNLEEADSDEDDQVSSTSRIAGNAVRTGELVDEDSGQNSAGNVSDSLREVEARETIRRSEEARHLAEQMRQVDSNMAHKELKSVPISVEASESAAGDSVARVDKTQELFIQQLLDKEDEELSAYEARSRSSTPLSTPAQMIRAITGNLVDADWDSFEPAVEAPAVEAPAAEEQDELESMAPSADLGAEISEQVIYAARDAVEAREPVMVAGELVDTTDVTDSHEVHPAHDGPAERREQSIEDAAGVSKESRKERAEKITLPMNMAALRVELEKEQSLEEAVEDDSAKESAEGVWTSDGESSPRFGVISIDEETSPEEDVEQEHRVASAFESVEEFEAPLFDAVDPQTTSLQSPREGEIVRANFDLKKSGYQNVRGMVLSLADDKSEPGEQNQTVETSKDDSVSADAGVDGDVGPSASADAAKDAELSEPEVAADEKLAKTATKKDGKSIHETAEVAAVKPRQISENEEEDSFFSNIDDPLMDHDEPRGASTNWKMPVLIVGIVALIVVLSWNGMKPAPAPEVKPDPVAEVVPVAPVEESAGVIEPESGALDENSLEGAVAELDEEAALANADGDGELIEDPELAAAQLAAEEQAAEQLAADELAAEKAVSEERAAEERAAEERAREELAAKNSAARVAGGDESAKVVAQKAVAAVAPGPATFDDKVLQLRYLVKRERMGEALKLARTLSAEAPTDRSVAFMHGQAALYERLNSEAIENLARAEKLGMRTSNLYMELGQAYQLAGQTGLAKQSYEAFLKIQPDGRSADEVRSILKNQF